MSQYFRRTCGGRTQGGGRCESVRTAFVEPPNMFTIAMAFRNEFRVRMSLQYAGVIGTPYSVVTSQNLGHTVA